MTLQRLSNTSRVALALVVGLGVPTAALVGCGGSGGSSSSAASLATGKATIKITWPTTTAKLIPAASNSITVTFLSGTSTVSTQTVARPTSGNTSTLSFTGLPAGSLTLVSTAYPTANGTGTAQASASQTATITAGSTASLAITMNSTIASLTASPSTVSVAAGSTTTVTATPVDSSGATVLVGSSTLSYASSDTAVATVSSTGVVTGVATGTVTITATESESGKTGTSTVTVTSTSGGTSIVDLTNAYLGTLTSTQLSVSRLSATSTNAAHWSNLPATPGSDGTNNLRNGVAYSVLSTTQQSAWLALAQAALGANGSNDYDQFTQIRYSDYNLGTQRTGYSGDYEYIASVGTPTASGYWLLQIGGHHNAQNYTYNGATLVSTTPYFLGVEPQSFTYNGTTYTPLGTSSSGQEGTMLSLVKSLTTTQAASANLNLSANGSKTFSDVYLGPGQDARSNFPTTNRGIIGSSLTSAQQTLVMNAIQQWTKNSPLQSTYDSLYQSELSSTYVAYSNATSNSTPSTITFGSQGDYVRIDGPHVWIEFVCQNGVVYSGIHFHTVWRDRVSDYFAQYFG